MAARRVCSVCGDVVGIYEPLLVVGSGPVRASSLAREPLLASSEEVIVHRACAAAVPTNGDGTPTGPEIASTSA